MATASPTSSACPVCDQPLPPDARAGCPSCRTPAATLELVDALDFAARRFEQWHQGGQLNAPQHQAIAESYLALRQELARAARAGETLPGDLQLSPATQCWSCRSYRQHDSLCNRCGAPLAGPGVRSLRYLLLLQGEIQRQVSAGRLSLAQGHALLGEVRGRIAALHNRLEKERVPVVQPARPQAVPEALPVVEPVEPEAPRRPLMELLLDPKNIQWLLVLGGALLVLGLVIWLGTLRLFDNPQLIAVVLGVANGAALLGGWALILGTRLQTAGRALTLLACLVMPFNLWFYDAHHLITLEDHLWAPALVCCALYAASALLLRDALFVPVLMAGVALAGLLILADRGVNRFWEVAAPATLLVSLGLAGIFAERAFPEGEGPFSRRKFGLAFFFSGHALLGAGLLFLLCAQAAGWTWVPGLNPWGLEDRPAIVREEGQKLLALGLFLAGFVAYLYSDLAVRKIGVYVYLAAFCLLWSELLTLLLLLGRDVVVPSEAVILMLALTALAANLLQASQSGRGELARALAPLGLMLSLLPVLHGLLLHWRATDETIRHLWRRADGTEFAFSWAYVGAMLVTALVCRLGAFLYRRTIPGLSATYFFLTGAATLVGAAGLLSVLGLTTWDTQTPVLMLLPIAYLVAARLYRGLTPEGPLVWVAHAATGVMLFAVLTRAVGIDPVQVFDPERGQALNLRLALFFAEAALFYGLAAVWRRDGVSVFFGAAAACGAVWQLLHFFHVSGEYHPVGFAVVGLALLLAYRLAVLERYRRGALADASFQCANALLSLAFVAAALMTLGRLMVLGESRGLVPPPQNWEAPLRSLAVVLGLLTAMSLAGAALVRHAAWRRWYVVVALVEGLLTFLVLNALSGLSPWEKFEIFCVVVGLVMLALAHWGWYREQEQHNDLVTLGLVMGSLAVAVPLMIAVLVHRSGSHFSTLNELGLLVLGLLMLATGVLLQLKATAVSGGIMVGLYVVTLPMFLRTPRWLENLEGASLWMIFGGGGVFLVGLLLSVFRDRLLTLPDKIRRREGIFRLLSWR
jgi:hypothetical protein